MFDTAIKIEGVMTNVSLNLPDGITDLSFLEAPHEVVNEEITSCGHSVRSSILDALGFNDYCNAKCHHCKYYDGEITQDHFNELCEMEEGND